MPMKPLLRIFLFICVALLVVGGAVYAAWYVVNRFFIWIAESESQIAGAALVLAVTVLVGIFAILESQQRVQSRKIAESRHPHKIQLYENLVKSVSGATRNHKGKDALKAADLRRLENAFADFMMGALLWSSPTVLQSYEAFTLHKGHDEIETLYLLDDILRAMRTDLGLSNWGFGRGDFIKMLLSTPEVRAVVVNEL